MRSIKNNAILIIFLSAILLVVLYNFRLFNFYIEHMDPDRVIEHPGRFYRRLYYGIFNLFLEFIVFLVVAFFNYSWIDYLRNKFLKGKSKTIVLILGNLILLLFFMALEKVIFDSIFIESKRGFNTVLYLILNLSVFILAIVLAQFLILYRKNKFTEFENMRLREEKTKAELSALKEQISPHFFFNTLSTLSSIIRNGNKENGQDFIQEMSKTYRYTLSSGKKDLVTVDEELSFIRSYSFLLKKRFGEKLILNINVPKEYQEQLTPPMSLQILVENAIQHNVVTMQKPLTIDIIVQQGNIVVENTLQEKMDNSEGLGLGLENLANRFQLIAGKEIQIEKDPQKFRVILPLL